MAELKTHIQKVADGTPLSADEAADAFDAIMSGEASPAQIGAFLMALRVRGETVGEITGAVRTMRAKMLPVSAPGDAVDVVGTGGDAKGTHNISTCAAIVVAGAGVPVAKHGNRSISSKSGAADVLAALGVDLEVGPGTISRAIAEAGVGFMFAPAHHSAMRHVGPVRQELATRTIFNILGPLSNPAGTRRQVVGVFDRRWSRPMAETLQNLGSEHVWVVHGSGGLDELTTTGTTFVTELKNRAISEFEVTPADAGLATATLDDLRGGDARENAAAIRAVLAGESGPLRDIVILNAAAALIVAGRTDNLRDGAARAGQSIDSGAAANALARLVAVTNA